MYKLNYDLKLVFNIIYTWIIFQGSETRIVSYSDKIYYFDYYKYMYVRAWIEVYLNDLLILFVSN